MDGVGGMCTVEWCRCVCTDELEKARNAKKNDTSPPLEKNPR